MMRSPKPGTIFEVSTPAGLAYVQFIGRHPEYGETIRVLPGLKKERPTNFSDLARAHNYFTFYPVSAALRKGLIKSVSIESIPDKFKSPRFMRRAGMRSPDGHVLSWLIIDGDKEFLREKLSPEEKLLSIAAIWNHEYLVQRLLENWRPENEY